MGDLLTCSRCLSASAFPFQLIYSNEYWMVETGKHVFPLQKYRLVTRSSWPWARKREFPPPPPGAGRGRPSRPHRALPQARQDGRIERRGTQGPRGPLFPPNSSASPCFSVGGTILAARKAVESGLAIHIGGGFHHAFADHGEGFCLLNDVAIAACKAVADKLADRVMIVDCDLHQGQRNSCRPGRPSEIFTLSIHQMDIYPTEKPRARSTSAFGPATETTNTLAELRARIPKVYQEFRPNLILYLAGADPYEKDQLGGLSLTKAGLKERDKLVIESARSLAIPVAVALAGGYSLEIKDTVDIHLNTVRIAQRVQRIYPQPPSELAAVRRPV